MRARRQRGGTILEAVLFAPLLVLLLMGAVELGRVAYTYFTLQKILYNLARYLGTRQGVNFCDDSDATILAAKNYALTGTEDGSGDPLLPNLTADQIQIRIERYSAETHQLDACDCSASGCDVNAGGLAPDSIVVSLAGGYPVQLRIPRLVLDPIPLRPQVRLPYGGT